MQFFHTCAARSGLFTCSDDFKNIPSGFNSMVATVVASVRVACRGLFRVWCAVEREGEGEGEGEGFVKEACWVYITRTKVSSSMASG